MYSSLLVLPMTTALPRRVGKADTTGRNPLPPMEGILSPFLFAFALSGSFLLGECPLRSLVLN